jgi:SAM-dependent methyltransferase
MSARGGDRTRHLNPARSRSSQGEPTLPSPGTIVRKGWNRLSTTYRPPGAKSDCFLHTDSQYREWLGPVVGSLEPGTPVLDLGCGTGEPASRQLAKRFQVTGVDLSEVMIRRAREAVPSGRFIRADMTRINFPPGSFGAVVSLYAIIHVPLVKQKLLMTRIYSWLGPRGIFLAVLGHEAWEGTAQGWLGVDVPMFWSHAAAATYRRWLRETGFNVVRQEFVPEGDGGHELFLARKRAHRRSGLSRAKRVSVK